MSDHEIRQARVRQFLKFHLVLCALACGGWLVEFLTGAYYNVRAVFTGMVVISVSVSMIGVGFKIYRRRRLTNWVVPVILAVDSVLVLVQLMNENGLESGWAATPALLTVLMPLYSDDRRLRWGLTGFQVLVYLLLLWLRTNGWIDYQNRPDSPDTYLYSTQGMIFLMIGAAFFAGQASLDVLNSQKQLQDEVDAATDALRKAQAQLVQQAKMAGLGQLTAGVAHEINNPLTFVQTNLTSVERDMRDVFGLVQAFEATLPVLSKAAPDAAEEIEELLEDIGFDEEMVEMLGELMDDARDGLERVQRIIADLRTFSRAGTAELRPIDLNQACTLAVQQFEKVAKVEVEESHADLEPVQAYPMLLNQVLVNLLRNARDAMAAENGKIVLRTLPNAAGAYVEVEDNGTGVPDEIRERIFEPFFTTKEVGQGTGLGLAISYQIIEHHQGRIEVDQAEHGGAIFRIWLPKTAVAQTA